MYMCVCEGKARGRACHHRGPAFLQQLIRALRQPHEEFQRWTNEAFRPQMSGCQPRRVISPATVYEKKVIWSKR